MFTQDTYDIWQEAIAYCKPGKHYKGIGGVIEDLCTAKGYTTVPNFCESSPVAYRALPPVLSSGIITLFVLRETYHRVQTRKLQSSNRKLRPT